MGEGRPSKGGVRGRVVSWPVFALQSVLMHRTQALRLWLHIWKWVTTQAVARGDVCEGQVTGS